ncbi:hypothetical protein UlMin_010208 [Ulmus minor]
MAPTFVKSFMFLVLLSQVISLGFANWFIPVERVEIISDLTPLTNLTVHCKSKDNDLGEQVIVPPKHYAFSFKPTIFGNTLFFCSFLWPGDYNLHWYDIYNENRDLGRCKHHCCWFVHNEGPCLGTFNGTHCSYREDYCYPWNKQ